MELCPRCRGLNPECGSCLGLGLVNVEVVEVSGRPYTALAAARARSGDKRAGRGPAIALEEPGPSQVRCSAPSSRIFFAVLANESVLVEGLENLGELCEFVIDHSSDLAAGTYRVEVQDCDTDTVTPAVQSSAIFGELIIRPLGAPRWELVTTSFRLAAVEMPHDSDN